MYDFIFDAVGKQSFGQANGSLKPSGLFMSTDGWQNLFLAVWTWRFGDKKVALGIPPAHTRQNVVFLRELIEKGKYRAVIDRCYPLEQVVDAARCVETLQKTGNVVLTL